MLKRENRWQTTKNNINGHEIITQRLEKFRWEDQKYFGPSNLNDILLQSDSNAIAFGVAIKYDWESFWNMVQ